MSWRATWNLHQVQPFPYSRAWWRLSCIFTLWRGQTSGRTFLEFVRETQLIRLAARNTSQGRQTYLILLDFSIAFDRVNYLKLLHKLNQNGVRSNTLSWIKSFWLGARKQLYWRAKAHQKSLSNLESLKVLCLALYCFYVILTTYLRLSTHRSDFLQLARLSISHSDSDTLQQDLDTLQTWIRLWDMYFNPSKCQLLHFSNSRHPPQHIYIYKIMKKMYKMRLQRDFLKLVSNDWSDKRFLLTLKFCPLGMSAPDLRLYTFIKS